MGDFDDFPDPPEANAAPPAPRRVDLGTVDDAIAAGTPAAKFEHIGDTIKGTILSAEMSQQRDMATGKPLFWEDGNPRTQVLIDLATDQRSDDIEDDNGHRRLYCKKPGAMLKAIATALGKTKLSQSIGGTLAVKYSGDGEPSQRGFNPPKLFVAKFMPMNGHTSAPVNNSPASSPPNPAATDAWKKFCVLNANEPAEVRTAAWKALLRAHFGTKPKEHITAREWGQLVASGFRMPEMANAISDEQQFKEDDIPF